MALSVKELQIGDWVTILRFRENDSDRNVRVNAIGYDCILAPGMFQDETGCDPYDEKKIAPIPLTAEILEKNGWKKHATYGTEEDDCVEVIYMLYMHSFEVVFNDDEAVSIRHFVSSDDDGYDKLLIEMRDNGYKPMYVHTLQHALRLFGLTELADNFKV